MIRRFDQRSKLKWSLAETAVVLLTLGVCAIVMLVTVRIVDGYREEALDRTRAEVRNLLLLSEETLSFRISQIDALQGVAALIGLAILDGRSAEAGLAIRELTTSMDLGQGQVVQVAIADATGKGIYSTSEATSNWSIADREHFKAVTQGKADTFVGRPVIGRSSGILTSQFTRAIRRADGTLAGVTVVSIKPRALLATTVSTPDNRRLHLRVLRSDGVSIGSRNETALVEQTAADAVRWRNLISAENCGNRTPAASDGVPRVRACGRMAGYDLIVVAAIDEAQPLEWAQEQAVDAWVQSGLVLALCLITGGVGVFVVRWRRHSDRLEIQRIARQRMGDLVLNAPGVLYELELNIDQGEAPHPTRLLIATGGEIREQFDPTEAEVFGFLGWSLPPEAQRARQQTLRQALLEGGATQEYHVTLPDGQDRIVRDRLTRLMNDGHRTVLSGHLLDVTEDRAMAQSLTRSATLITLGEMASGIAHELNQPLAAINLAAHNAGSLLRRGKPPEEVKAKLDRISKLVERATSVTAHIRSLGRGESAFAPFQVADAVNDAVELLDSTLRLGGIELVVDVPPSLPLVHGTAVGFQQVIINLLNNAIDAYGNTIGERAGETRGLIRISASARHGLVEIEVADRAGGIPQDAMDRIFSPFFTTKSPGKGMGLGLALSYRTVQDMGGTILVANRNGGACFTIRLTQQGRTDATAEATTASPSASAA